MMFTWVVTVLVQGVSPQTFEEKHKNTSADADVNDDEDGCAPAVKSVRSFLQERLDIKACPDAFRGY